MIVICSWGEMVMEFFFLMGSVMVISSHGWTPGPGCPCVSCQYLVSRSLSGNWLAVLCFRPNFPSCSLTWWPLIRHPSFRLGPVIVLLPGSALLELPGPLLLQELNWCLMIICSDTELCVCVQTFSWRMPPYTYLCPPVCIFVPVIIYKNNINAPPSSTTCCTDFLGLRIF